MTRSFLVERVTRAPRLVAAALVVALMASLALVSIGPLRADPLLHRFSVDSPSVDEPATGTTTLTFRISLNAPAPDATTVTFRTNASPPSPPVEPTLCSPTDTTTVCSTARPGADYVENMGGTLTFAAFQTAQEVVFTINSDSAVEPEETIVVELTGATNASYNTAPGIGTIRDTDSGATPGIAIADKAFAEGDTGETTGQFTVTVSNPSTAPIEVDYRAQTTTPGAVQSPDAGADFALVNGRLTIPVGETSGTIDVKILGDKVFEDDETFNVVLFHPSNAQFLDSDAIGTITNDDAQPSLYVIEKKEAFEKDDNDVRKNEGDSGDTPFEFVVKLLDEDGNETVSGRPVQVEVQTQNDTATAPSDYDAVSRTLNFGTTESSIDVTVNVNGDTTSETNEQFFLLLTEPVGASIGGNRASGLILNDDGGGPVVAITSADADPDTEGQQGFKEGDTGVVKATFTISIPQAPTDSVSDPAEPDASIDFRTLVGSANTSDFTVRNGTVGWKSTDTGAALTKTVTVDIRGDTLDEPDENFLLEILNPVNVSLPPQNQRQGSAIILDDDDPAQLAITDVSVDEPDTAGTVAANFVVTLSQASGQTVTVQAATADQTATGGTGPTADYVTRSQTLTFAPGVTSQTFTVTVNGDTDPEPNETFLVNLNNPSGASSPSRAGIGTILNDDGPAPSVAIAPPASPVTEGNSGTTNAAFTLTRSTAGTTQTVTVRYSTEDITAKADKGTDKYDFVGATNATVTFATNQTTATLNVPVNGDIADEDDETFRVRLLSASNASLDPDPAKRTAVATITDDDTEPLKVSVNDAPIIAEKDNETVEMRFPVVLNARPGRTVTVDFTTASGTATAGADYVARSGTLTFAPDDNPTQDVVVVVKGDTINEDDETIALNLSDPSATAVIERASATGTIDDNDPLPSLSVADVSANEGAGQIVFTVSLSAVSGKNVTVDFETADGTNSPATAGTDYTAKTGTLAFAPGDPSKTVAVTVANDTAEEPDETLLLKLTNPTNATIAGDTGTGTIADNDASGSLSVLDTSVTEGTGGTTNISFPVKLAQASTKTVSVRYGTENGTAREPDDYALRTGQLTFAPGETEKTVVVPVVTDDAPEQDEDLFLRLVDPSNAQLADAIGRGVIVNDDAFPVSPEITTGPGRAGGPHIRRFTASNLSPNPTVRGEFMGRPASSNETVGATVARGDVYPDILGDEIITGTNQRGSALVRVWTTGGTLLTQFNAYPGLFGGVYVAAANFDGDGADEIVTGPGAGGGPHVKVWNVNAGNGAVTEIGGGFMAYDPAFSGGVFVAAGDLDGDGRGDIATGAGEGGGPHVKLFRSANGVTWSEFAGFMPYPAAFTGGVRVAIGVDGDEKLLVTGAGPGGGPHVGISKFENGRLVDEGGGFMAYDPRFGNGISVAVGDINGDGRLDIVTGAGPGGGPHVQGFRATSAKQSYGPGFMAYRCVTFPNDCFTNGIWVALGDG